MAAPAQEDLRALLHHGAVAGQHSTDAVDFEGPVFQGSDLDLAHTLNIYGAGASTRVELTGNVDPANGPAIRARRGSERDRNGISDQTIYGWRRQELIDCGQLPGLNCAELSELSAANKRIRELETEAEHIVATCPLSTLRFRATHNLLF